MSPERAIAMLDMQVEKHGQDIRLMRGNSSWTIKAPVRGYRPEELGNGILQGDSEVVVSPTQLARHGLVDVRRLDRIEVAGRTRIVEYATPTPIGGKVVRWEILVRG